MDSIYDLSSTSNSGSSGNILSSIMDLSDISATNIPGLTITRSNNPATSILQPPTIINNGNGITGPDSRYPNRRVLRPRVEARSYAEPAESPDTNLNGDKTDRSQNGTEIDSDDDEKMIPLYEVKELSAAEIWERERELRKMREELRNEETKLVLLKKIKHSQTVMKENKTPANATVQVAQNLTNSNAHSNSSAILNASVNTSAHSNVNAFALLSHSLPKGSLTVTPSNHVDYKSSASITRHLQMPDQSTSCYPLPRQSLPGGATLSSGASPRTPMIQGMQGRNAMDGRSSSNLSITPSVTITPTSGPVMNMKSKNVSQSFNICYSLILICFVFVE